jgi:hypothetical protein
LFSHIFNSHSQIQEALNLNPNQVKLSKKEHNLTIPDLCNTTKQKVKADEIKLRSNNNKTLKAKTLKTPKLGPALKLLQTNVKLAAKINSSKQAKFIDHNSDANVIELDGDQDANVIELDSHEDNNVIEFKRVEEANFIELTSDQDANFIDLERDPDLVTEKGASVVDEHMDDPLSNPKNSQLSQGQHQIQKHTFAPLQQRYFQLIQKQELNKDQTTTSYSPKQLMDHSPASNKKVTKNILQSTINCLKCEEKFTRNIHLKAHQEQFHSGNTALQF